MCERENLKEVPLSRPTYYWCIVKLLWSISKLQHDIIVMSKYWTGHNVINVLCEWTSERLMLHNPHPKADNFHANFQNPSNCLAHTDFFVFMTNKPKPTSNISFSYIIYKQVWIPGIYCKWFDIIGWLSENIIFQFHPR